MSKGIKDGRLVPSEMEPVLDASPNLLSNGATEEEVIRSLNSVRAMWAALLDLRDKTSQSVPCWEPGVSGLPEDKGVFWSHV